MDSSKSLSISSAVICLVLVMLCVFLCVYSLYTVSSGVSDVADCIGDPIGCVAKGVFDIDIDVGVPAECPPGYEKADGPGGLFCYKPCPEGWKGGSTVHHCQKHTIYSTVGADPSKSIPSLCKTPTDNTKNILNAGLCYNVPDDSWHVTSPGFIGKKCPATVDGQQIKDDGTSCWYTRGVGKIPAKRPCSYYDSRYRDDGTSCWIDTYGRGAGYALWDKGKCEAENPQGCEQYGLLYYPKCNSGYKPVGCCLCEPDGGPRAMKRLSDRQYCNPDEEMIAGLCYKKPKPGFKCVGIDCRYSKEVKSKIGQLPTGCPPDRELHGRLCYPKCGEGYTRDAGNIEYCSKACPDGYTDIGIGGCVKPKEELIKIGVCPQGKVKSGARCYDEKTVMAESESQ